MPVNGERSIGQACLSDEELAAYLDGVLSAEDRRAAEEHLASCDDCRTILAESVHALEAIDLKDRKSKERGGPIPFPTPGGGAGGGGATGTPHKPTEGRGRTPRKMWQTIGWLAAAAVALLVARDPLSSFLGFGPAGARTHAQAALIAAVAEQRTFEPRLSGGFRYAPVQGVTRSGDPRGLRLTPDVTIATARISQLAEHDNSVDAQALLGGALLVAGDLDGAIKALEAARSRDPRRASILSDLSAAYYVRAERTGRTDDYTHALDTAKQAIALDPSLLEARFNLALATERTQPAAEARQAWEAYLQQDSGSRWAAEDARRHLANLPILPH
jgi:tetratricopeptide (TPR) repeat protein